MKQIVLLAKRHIWTIVLLVGTLAAVRWVVVAKRGPGSMTVVEAQAMDMAGMKAPTGAFPVVTDHALVREVGGTETFPATVAAFSDEDVVARIAGLVQEVFVYPGDRVRSGQLLAKIQADEVTSSANAAALSASAMRSNAVSAKEMVKQERAAVSKAEFGLQSALAATEAAQEELNAMEASVDSATQSVEDAKARLKEAEAQLNYAKINFERKKSLFAAGAIAKNDLDEAQRDIGEAQARTDQAKAQQRMAESELVTMTAKRKAAASMVKQTQAEAESARAEVGEAKAGLSRAESEAKAMGSQAASADAEARSSSALSSYTELRAASEGVVTERLVSPGTPVMMGQAVLRVKADRTLRVQAEIPQRLAGRVPIGSAVRVIVNERSLDARVTSVAPYVESGSRSFRIEALLPNKNGEIQVGSFAGIEIVTAPTAQSLSVPRSAVKTASDGSHYVWLVKQGQKVADKDADYTCTMHPQVHQKGPGTCPICKMDLVPSDAKGALSVERRNVKVGDSDSSYTAVVDGLNEGDRVTTQGDDELFPGAAIMERQSEEPTSVEVGGKKMMKGHEGHTHGPNDKFTCPMHPEVHRPGPGSCPVCKMDLVPIEDK